MAVSFRVRSARRACGRGMRPQGVGRFETACGRRAYSPCGYCISRPPDAEQTASDVPDALGTKNPPDCRRWVPPQEEFRRSLEASLRRGWRGVYLHLHAYRIGPEVIELRISRRRPKTTNIERARKAPREVSAPICAATLERQPPAVS